MTYKKNTRSRFLTIEFNTDYYNDYYTDVGKPLLKLKTNYYNSLYNGFSKPVFSGLIRVTIGDNEIKHCRFGTLSYIDYMLYI